MRRIILLILAALVGCHETDEDVLGLVPDAGPPADAAPTPDAEPDAVPDSDRTGPLALHVELPVAHLKEGAAPVTLTVRLTGALDSPVTGRLTVEGVEIDGDPRDLRFTDDDRSSRFALRVPVDADDIGGRARITAVVDGVDPVELELRVYDAHHTIELNFDAEQLAFVRTSNDKDHRLVSPILIDFEPGPPVESNLRGKGTLRCARRSFTTRFDDLTRIGDSPPLDHILFLSMCLDSTYMKMRVASEVLQARGLFPLWFTLAELRYGGESRGVYLVVERPRKGVPRVHPANHLLVRRLNDSNYEIKRPKDEDIDDVDALMAPYLRLYELRRELSGQALLDALRGAMDYELYLRWLALNSMLENGDYIDEVYFYDGSRRPDGVAGEGPYFAPMAWDYDDIFDNCHTPQPIADPLYYCAESGLDRATRDTPEARAEYVRVLREMMADLDPDAFAEIVHRVRDEMAPYLARPGVVEVMTREDEGPPDIDAGAEEMIERFRARYATLQDRLEDEP